jgi:hypothetical protein
VRGSKYPYLNILKLVWDYLSEATVKFLFNDTETAFELAICPEGGYYLFTYSINFSQDIHMVKFDADDLDEMIFALRYLRGDIPTEPIE